MDGIGGTVKNLVFRHVKSGKVVINTPEEFAHYADNVCEGVYPLYLPKEEILVEPSHTETAGIENTLQIHKVQRLIIVTFVTLNF